MTRVISAITLLSLFVLAAPSAAQSALDKRVSLDLKAMAPPEAFNVIANAIGYTAEVAPDVSTPVDIVVGNITARTALNTICESIGCSWKADGAVIRVATARRDIKVRMSGGAAAGVTDRKTRGASLDEMRRMMDQPLPADMKFEHAPLADVAARLSKATGFDVSLAGTRPDRTFSGDLGGRPFSAALKTIGEQVPGAVATIRIAGRKGERPMWLKFGLGARKPRK